MGCTLCHGGKYVTVDAAIRWKVRRDSQPSQPAPAVEKKPSECDSLLLSAIDSVLQKLAAVDGREGARALSERATTLRDTVLDWQECAPSEGERHDITGKVLGLHVKLGRLLRGGAK